MLQQNQQISKRIQEIASEQNVQYIDLRYADLFGVWHSITYRPEHIALALNQLSVDLSSAFINPFTVEKTVIFLCNHHAADDARSLVAASPHDGLGQHFRIDLDFHIFDDVKFNTSAMNSFVAIDCYEDSSNNHRNYETSNSGHRTENCLQQVGPLDTLHDLRSEMCVVLENIGVETISHQHLSNPGQCQISFIADGLLNTADAILKAKYAIKSIANSYGKSATFMPMPLAKDVGSALTITCQPTNPQQAISGIIGNLKAINAFSNPTANSYLRLAHLTSACSIKDEHSLRITFPDPASNPYLLLLALSSAAISKCPAIAPEYATSLSAALQHLEDAHQFLLPTIPKATITAYMSAQRQKLQRYRTQHTPLDFVLDYSC